MKQKILILILLIFLGFSVGFACTSVIISGRVTNDGRPLLLKNRDTEDLHNHIRFLQGEKYKLLAIVADKSVNGERVWSGHNEAGFAIINTAAYNLNRRRGDGNDGKLMRRALDICASLTDFEHYLDTITRPIGANSNFGVIDAYGGAAYYEVGDSTFTKFDVNDRKVAPNGYLIRTNHGFSGDRNLDKGISRYLAASEYIQDAFYLNELDAVGLITKLTRYLKHGLTHINLRDFVAENDSERKFLPFRDFIPRYQTASAQLFQGVREGESPLNTVAWTIVGSTLTTVAIPLFITQSGTLPSVVVGGHEKSSPLNAAGLKLKERLFPMTKGNGRDYIDVSKLINKSGNGILQQITEIEDEIVKKGLVAINDIRQNGNTDRVLKNYNQWVDDFINQEYSKRFSINVNNADGTVKK